MSKKYSLYTVIMTCALVCHYALSFAQPCGFLNKPENGNTYYPRTTNQTVGMAATSFLRFEVKNTGNYIWDVCGYSVYDTQLTGYPSSNTLANNWYNDDYCVGYGGNVRASSSQYLGTNGWPSTFDGLEYVQLNPFNCAGWANYGSATLNYRCVAPTGLAAGTPGNGTWNIYCYDAGDAVGGSGAWTNNYSGYYTDNTLSFNTGNRWTNTPYEANATGGQAYRGCYILPDNHSWRAVRTNIACGVYQLQVTHDDIGQIFINGSAVYNNANCCLSTNAGTFVIAPSDVIEYRVSEGGGGSNGLITFNNAATTLNGGSITYGGGTSACASYDPPAFGNGGDASGGASAGVSNGSSTYQWQVNGGNIGGANGTTYDPGALAAGTYAYRRQITDRCGNVAYSNTVTITVVAPSAIPTLNTKTPNVASVCAGTSVNASINAGSGGGSGAADTYEFSINGGGSWSLYTSGAAINTASATGSVQVRVSRSAGSGSNCNPVGPTVIATWNIDPTPGAVSVATSGTYCGGTFINASGGSGGTIYYQGTTSGGTSTALATTSQIITTSGTYYFRAQSGAGCWGPEGSAAIVIQTPVPYYADVDNDGYGDPLVSTYACSPPIGYVSDNTDCNDANNTVHAGAPEICDGLDNNCNGSIDEGVQNTYYADADADGFGNAAVTTLACSPPPGYVANSTDCNDANNTVYPGAPEICDGLDNNCNGSTDEGVLSTYYADSDADGFGDAAVTTLACSPPPGYVANNTDCNDSDGAINPGAAEICDGLDNNCNGSTDEGVLTTYYADTDGDSYGDPLVSTQACTQPVGYTTNNTDCDDTNNAIYPGAFEICGNGIDEDCDGLDPICTGIVWSGATSTDWNTPTNWIPFGIPNNCASDVTIPLVPNQPSITGSDFNVGDMTVANGVIISVQNGYKLNVCGDVNVSGATGLEISGGDISFMGNTPQTVTGNVTADAVILSNAAGLTLAGGGSMSVALSVSLRNGVLTSNSNLTLLSDASGTAYVDDFTGGFTGSISGNINVQRYNPIGLAGFRQLGTPVQMPNISGVSGFTPSGTAGFVIPVPTCDPNYVAFNSPYGNWMQLVENGTVQYSCHQSLFQVLTSGGMTSARGYYLDVPGNSTLTFTGANTTGPVSFGLTHANTAVTNGWNMVSNPYPSPLAWETGNIPTGVDGIAKIWVTSGAYTGTWQDLDPNISGTAVAIGQAFQVRVTTPGASVPFTVDNSDRTTAPPTYLFAGGPGMTLNIDILGNGFADVTKVRFMDNATISLDAMYDSPKMMGNANQPMVYSIWGSENYSTNSFGGLTEVYALPLGVKLAQAGQHTLVFSNADQFPASALIYLEDVETGTWQDIRQNDTYVFTETVGNHTDRFILHFYPPVQSAITDATCETNGQAVLTEESPVSWTYVMTNAQSQTVSQGTLNGSQTVNNLPAGTYTLTLTEPVSGYVAVETVTVTGAVQVSAQAMASLLAVEPGQEIQFTANTVGADTWHWSFGDINTSTEENPTHFYNAPGTYEVILTAANSTCQTVSQLSVQVQSSASIQDALENAGVTLWNDGNVVYIQFNKPWMGKTVFTLYDIQGRKLVQKQWNGAEGTLSIDCGVLAAGTYTAELAGTQQTVTRKTVMGVR